MDPIPDPTLPPPPPLQQQPLPKPKSRVKKVLGLWKLGKTLGRGSMGKVKMALNVVTGEKVLYYY